MAAERNWVTYTADDGTQYEVLIPHWTAALVTGATALGFTGFDASKPTKPRQVKMRYITLTSQTTARHRKLHAGTGAAAGYATLGTTFSLPNIDGTSESYTSTGRVGEKLQRGPHS